MGELIGKWIFKEHWKQNQDDWNVLNTDNVVYLAKKDKLKKEELVKISTFVDKCNKIIAKIIEKGINEYLELNSIDRSTIDINQYHHYTEDVWIEMACIAQGVKSWIKYVEESEVDMLFDDEFILNAIQENLSEYNSRVVECLMFIEKDTKC